ncbi:reverse transcriptase domain-containing protein [Tanacetum coccineum]
MSTRRFIRIFPKSPGLLTHLQEKETLFYLLEGMHRKHFETLKMKVNTAPILVAPDWDLPFEIMCDASDFAVGAVLGQRAENLTADHLSRLENPHQSELEKKEITETFPLETLGMVTFRGDNNTPWFADFANYHAGNFICADQVIRHCVSGKKLLTFLKLATVDPLGDTTVPITPLKRSSIQAVPRLQENNIYSCSPIIYQNGLKQKRSPPTTPELFAISYISLARFRCPLAIIMIADPIFAIDQVAKVKLKYGVTHLPPPGVSIHNKWTTGDHRKVQLNKLNELRDHAYENSLIYKEKTKRIHDSKIKNRVFNVGDRVLLFNSRLKIFSGKLKTRWSGPLTVTQVFPYGTVELSQNSGPNFKVNGHRLKHYFGGDVPQLVVPDLQTFPMIQ